MRKWLQWWLLYLSWLFGDRRETKVDSEVIKYCLLPWWLFRLAGGGVSRQVLEKLAGGLVITDSVRRRVMVFISPNDEPLWLPLLYHEHQEGWYMIDGASELEEIVVQKQIDALEADEPHLREHLSESLGRCASREEFKNHLWHVYALVAELTLAKKELPPDVFLHYLATTLELGLRKGRR